MLCRRSLTIAFLAAITATSAQVFSQQVVISQIAAMPYIPVNYSYENYTAIAQGFDATVFNPVAQSTYQYKTFWFQTDRENGISEGFGMPSYVGQTQATEGNGEAITTIAAVLGASLVGIDKQSQTLSDGNTYDFVQMASRYYDSGTGANLVLNNIGSTGTGSFWYDQLPQILFDGLISEYYSSYAPGSAGQQRLDTIISTSAAKMHSVIDVLAGNSTTAVPNFNYQGFNYVTMQPITGDHTEPDGAGGAAYEQYMAYIHTGNATDLGDAERCIQALQNTPANQNPLYETVLPFGALTAARLNAEQGTNYDVAKMVNWCFSPTSVVRSDWGAISASQWNGYGAAGLIGSTTDQGGYGFSMNSYLYPAALVPLVRYDDRFANSIGQWMLNLTNSARMFLKSDLPTSNQTNASWSDAPSNYYSYEGVKESSNGVSPQAGGDGTGYNSNWLNFAYGSGDVGVLGSIVAPTNVSMILQLNLLATDFFHEAADPSYLLYNPYNTMMTVQVNVGSSAVNVYDAITDQFLATNVTGLTSISIPGESSRSLVYTPVGGALVDNDTNVSVNGVVVNYRSPELNRLYWNVNGSGTWDSSTANWTSDADGTVTNPSWIAGRVAMLSAGSSGSATITVSGPQSIGGLDFQSGNITLQSGSFLLASDSTITAASGTQTINTPISGSFALLKDGPGTIVLGAINTYTGITTIEQGVVRLANTYALDFTNVDVDVNSGLDLNSLNPTLGGLSGFGSLNLGSQTLTVGNDNQSATYSGTIASSSGTLAKIGNGAWTFSGSLVGTANFTVSGAGLVTLSGSNTFTGTTTIAAGSTLLATSNKALSLDSNFVNNGTLNVAASSFTGGITGAGTLSLGSAVTLTLSPKSGASTQNALNIAPGSTLDINNDSFTLNYVTAADPISTILADLVSGYAGGAWDGSGIISGPASSYPSTTVGYIDTGSQIKIVYTWYGDTDLSGTVTASDLANMSPTGTTWSTGDFNYDGKVNADDYALFALGAAASHGENISVVPEPCGGVLILGSVLLGQLASRRRIL
ncbi:MAG TPA: autotransporter-associated beta strand repeat-containing protein [Tepidisphaeraceae bacterium]|jgi:autotransporter-associated beta strand protein